MLPHEWLTDHLRHLHWYAQHLRDALLEPGLSEQGRGLIGAAAKYLVEWEDLIPDTDAQFGYVDDLFVILLALEELILRGGAEGAALAARPLPNGEGLGVAAGEARAMFPTFLAAVAQEVGPGFEHVARAMAEEPGVVDRLAAMLGNYIAAYAAAPRPLQPIDEPALDAFLKHYGLAEG